MNDIVERLRDRNYIGQELMRNEAADEIERLSARLAEVERERDKWKERAADRCDEAERRARKQWDAEARAERLETALRPLVEACESDFTSEATEAGVGRERDDEPVSFTIGGIGCDLTFGHIRRGRAALELAKEPQG